MTDPYNLPDPITAMAAALPQCSSPRAVRLDLGREFHGRTRSGQFFTSPFSCGTQAIAFETTQMVKSLAEREGTACALDHRGLSDRADMVRASVERDRDAYLAMLGRFFADPVVCTCDTTETD
ncbi:hypothetical protein [Streptomyces sp. NPDC088739]|uniref:hypothetical protein n=1 Tax=Streptomyces sp. NPDC088739 TaxID=3365882 RepID=UPI0037FBD589